MFLERMTSGKLGSDASLNLKVMIFEIKKLNVFTVSTFIKNAFTYLKHSKSRLNTEVALNKHKRFLAYKKI